MKTRKKKQLIIIIKDCYMLKIYYLHKFNLYYYFSNSSETSFNRFLIGKC